MAIDTKELERLAQVGSGDSVNEVKPDSVFTSIAATIMVCTSPAWASLASAATTSIAASTLYSCANNPKVCD